MKAKNKKQRIKVGLIVLVVILFLNMGMPTAQQASWLSGWEYRKPMTIQENSGNTLTDYQIKLDVSYTPGMNPDFSDLRFTEDGTTLLPYWIEEYTTGTTATVWVKIPEITASSEETIYMYYGNSEAGNIGSPIDTFMVYDDFSTNTMDSWLIAASGQDSYTYDSTNQRLNFYCRGRDASIQYIAKQIIIDTGICVEADWRFTADPVDEYTNYFGTFLTSDLTKMRDSTTQNGFGIYMNDGYDGSYDDERLYSYLVDNTLTRTSNEETADYVKSLYTHWFHTKVYYNKNQFKAEAWEDGTTQVTNSTYTANVNPISYVAFGDMITAPAYGYHTDNTPGWVDNIRVRKYTSPEPTYVIGSEETPNNAPILVSQELCPASPTDSDDLQLNAQCSDADAGDTLTAYWNCYKDTVRQDAYSSSTMIANNVNSQVETINNADTTPGQQWYCSVYCSDGKANTTTAATSTKIIGVACSEFTDWEYLTASGGTTLQVRDSNSNGKYDQICCEGTVTAITAF